MSIDQVKLLIQAELDAVNQLIIQRAKEKSTVASKVIDHIISSGGKRIRPVTILLSAKACGYEGDTHVTLAALVECFHTATLLHDDVVDNSALRRGVPTVHSLWGNKTSILVGDFLFTLAMKLITEIKHDAIQSLLAKISHDVTCGELKQLSLQYTSNHSIDDYIEIIRLKTAVLFALSSTMGPLLVHHAHPFERAFYDFGLHLGNTFQLIDDTLDYTRDASITGKTPGTDLADGKATLPLLHVLKHGNELQKKLIQTSLTTGSNEHFSDILDAVESTGAIEYTRAAAKRESDLAIAAITMIPDSPYKQALITMAQYALERSH